MLEGRKRGPASVGCRAAGDSKVTQMIRLRDRWEVRGFNSASKSKAGPLQQDSFLLIFVHYGSPTCPL